MLFDLDGKDVRSWQLESKQILPLDKDKIPYYDGKEWKGDNLMSNQNNGSKPNKTQIDAMYKAYKAGYINKGTIDGTVNETFKTSK